MEKLNKLLLPAVILIASIILGGFYYAGEVNKQRFIEKQQQIKIEKEKQNGVALSLCFLTALTKRQRSVLYWKDYGDKNCAGLSIEAEGHCHQGVLDYMNKAFAEEKEDRVECLKIYPQ
jgi:hypothetical protein